eukprot:TRINITY_DN9145_c0_g1_i1.p1 TRINITY_DN9145_c0_g1~~TRINITY_DN9145_c0_g1_i1.p1  ORF type:complete len:589 (-),score=152.08 TRINITY_DN9145_c0_g1_i1:56-1750(-)
MRNAGVANQPRRPRFFFALVCFVGIFVLYNVKDLLDASSSVKSVVPPGPFVSLPGEIWPGAVQNERRSVYVEPPLPTSCKLRTNLLNPIGNEDQFKCDYPGWGKNIETHLVDGPMAPSERNCMPTNGPYVGHCEYKNVCLYKDNMHYYAAKGETPNDFNFLHYRDRPQARPEFALHTWIKVFPASDIVPGQQHKWLRGTSFWYDQSYDSINHPGHSSETLFKVREVRDHFGGSIDRIIAMTLEQPRSYIGRTCNLLKVAFGEENFQFPPIYIWRMHEPYLKDVPVCFERVLVPQIHKEFFSSLEAADRYRREALRMCNITHREQNDKLQPTNVFFNERGFDRHLRNHEELCEMTRAKGYNAFVETLDDIKDWCHSVAIAHASDVVVAIDGSHLWVLPFMKPGSVLLLIYPPNFRAPDFKFLANSVGVRAVELQLLDKSLSLPNPRDGPDQNKSLWTPMIECLGYWCRHPLKARDTHVPPELYAKFFDYALTKYNILDPDECERNLPWPIPNVPDNWACRAAPLSNSWCQYGFGLNYKYCEPPEPNCECCHNDECMQVHKMSRTF